MIGLPPSELEALQYTRARSLKSETERLVGAEGSPGVVIWFEVPAGPVAATLVATTENV